MDTSLGINTLRPVDSGATPGAKPAGGNALPQGAKDSPAANSRRSLNDAVSRLREQAQSVQRNLEFSVDEASGETVVKVVAADIADYDRIYKKLIANIVIHDVSSSFAMEQIKYTTEVPVPGI